MQLFLQSAFIIVNQVNSGAILGRRRWIFNLKYIRIFIVMIAIIAFFILTIGPSAALLQH